MRKNQLIGVLFVFGLGLGLFLGIKPVLAVNPYIRINQYDSQTKSRQVILYLQGPERAWRMLISNNSDLSGGDWEPYRTDKLWYLTYGKGSKTVFVKFKDVWGVETKVYTDTISFYVPDSMNVDFTINSSTVAQTETTVRSVDLYLTWSSGVESVRISNTNDFSGSEDIKISSALKWNLTSGTGDKTVYVQFADANNTVKVVSHSIHYTQSERYIPEGTLLKGQTSTVYYLGYDGKIHPFTNSAIYHSWYQDFSGLTNIANAKLRLYEIGKPVCVRPGTWLVKFRGLPKVYAVEPGCRIRPLFSEANAYLIYGANWRKRVLELDSAEGFYYTERSYSVANKDTDVIDQDRDGLSKETEEENGTSDRNTDSDGDGLSDYEEINYWYSDPTIIDTNTNGINDTKEILRGYSPTGDKLAKVPHGSYEYPFGSVVKNNDDGKFYYHIRQGYYNYMADNLSSAIFSSNHFSTNFIIDSPFVIDLIDYRGRVIEKEIDMYYPTVSTNDVVSLL